MSRESLLYSVSLILLLALPQDLFGFGKNKITYQNHDWYIYDLGNYKLFLDTSQTNISGIVIRALKDSDEDLRGLTQKELSEVFPVILFPNQIDFQANNVVDEFISEDIGGFTEGLKNRLVMPIYGNWGYFKRVLKHEMVHVYQFDAIKSPQFRRILRTTDVTVPLWFIEGMAEYYSVEWDFSTEEIIRDISVNNNIIPISRLSDLNRLYPSEYILIYKQSQAFLKYIGDKFGKPTIYKIFKSYLTGAKEPFKAETGMSLEDLEKKFVYETRKKYLSLLTEYEEAEAFARSVTDEPYGSSTYSKFIPTFVSSNLIAFLTYKDIYPKIVLYDTKDKKIVKTLVIGGFNENYLEFHITRNNISASDNGIIVFVSRSGGRDAINVYNITNDSTYQITFENIRIISSPDISLDGEIVVFSGFDGKKEDIYLYYLGSKKLVRLTDDIFYDSEPRISPDKKYVYFVSTRNKSSIFSTDTDIYRVSLDDKSIEKFVDIGGEEQNPFVSRDGRYLLFVSTIDGVRNIFVYNFDDSSVRRFSKIISGAFSPKLDVTSSNIIFSSINNFTYNLYQKEFDISKAYTNEIKNQKEILASDISNFNFENERISGIQPRDVNRYVLMPTVDYITGAFSLSTDIGFIILLGAGFSDILGDQRLSILFNNAYITGPTSFSLSELNFIVTYYNYKYYFDFGFQVYNTRDYISSLMNFFYLPSMFYEVEGYYYSKSGFSSVVSYPFSTFSRVDLFVERTEYFDIPRIDYKNNTLVPNRMYSLNNLSLNYSYDSTLWTVVGPVNGIRTQLRASYYLPIFDGDKTLFSFIGDFRGYLMITLIDTIAFRIVGGLKEGQDARSMKFALGGIGTIRGYRFREFEGTYFLLSNLEIRIALIRALLGPFGFSLPPVFTSLFIDAGIIGDNPTLWQVTYFDENENAFKLKDLKVGMGIGFGVLLGIGFKLRLDFASPFDGRRLLDYQNWKGYLQIGYEF